MDDVEWSEQSAGNCTIARTLDIVGEKWTLLILRDAYSGLRRFDDFQRHIGVSRPVLCQRLAKLVDEGLLVRVPYREPGARERHEYRLTEKGLALYPALIALMQWGDRYLADPEGPPRILEHRDCGAPVHVQLACDDGHVVETARAVRARPGPSAHRLPAPTPTPA